MSTHDPFLNIPLLRFTLVAAACCLIGACTPSGEDSDIPELPDEDTPLPEDTGPFEIPEDTDNTGPVDQEPLHYLYAYQDGDWALTPSGGPYTALTGTLEVWEFIDYPRPSQTDTDIPWTDTDYPWLELEETPVICNVVYRVVGSASEPEDACSDCAWSMDIQFDVQSGDPTPCSDPDLPANGDIRRFGWRTSDSTLLYDYQGVGVWFPWYRANGAADQVAFSWFNRSGISLEEEDED